MFHPDVVEVINDLTIPVYVDADKRQDLTRQYLEGGWPSTTMFTPGRERLFGFSGPRSPEFLVTNVKKAVEYVETQGFSQYSGYTYEKKELQLPTENGLLSLQQQYRLLLLQYYDPVYGGFGQGQKFPQGRALDYALDVYEETGDERYLDVVLTTLKNQYTSLDELESNYNLFDPVEGGFHRYGTTRDWTPPHYEKMLYDNARLLKAYAHLQLVVDDDVVDEVVEKTDNYIRDWWFDDEGGFYGNTDVHGEDEYYGKYPRPGRKPRVEETKYSDWNSDAMITYSWLFSVTGDDVYKEMATSSLDFFAEEMVSDEGGYHYSLDGEYGVRGNLLDQSSLLVAFVEGFMVFGDEDYLEAAEDLAEYSVDELYDWHGGGFFERHSPDVGLYAPGESLLLEQPSADNGMMSYGLLQLYVVTEEPLTLHAGLTTLGRHLENVGTLDRGYYAVKAAELVVDHGLLDVYDGMKDDVFLTVENRRENFWLDDVLDGESVTAFDVSQTGVDELGGPYVLLLIIAFAAGLLSFLSPCTLPILPAYVAYVFQSRKERLIGMTLAFFLGLSVVFTLLGMGATAVGGFLRDNLTIFSQLAGVLIILFGVFLIFGKGFSGLKIKQKRPTTYLGAFVFGSVFGLSWTPCVGPILVALLVLASTTDSVLGGGLLLFVYGVGLSLPLLIVSLYLRKQKKKGKFWTFLQGTLYHVKIGEKTFTFHTTSLISGLLFVVLGWLIFTGLLTVANQYIATTGVQQWLFAVEEWLLGLVR